MNSSSVLTRLVEQSGEHAFFDPPEVRKCLKVRRYDDPHRDKLAIYIYLAPKLREQVQISTKMHSVRTKRPHAIEFINHSQHD